MKDIDYAIGGDDALMRSWRADTKRTWSERVSVYEGDIGDAINRDGALMRGERAGE